MIRRAQGAFRTSPLINMMDESGVGVAGAFWSTGQQLIDQLQLQPQATENWDILGYSVQAQLVFFPTANAAPFGRFGKLKAGLAIPLSQTLGANPGGRFAVPTPAFAPFTQLPDDTTLVSDLWDPATDAMPPLWDGLNSSVLPTSLLSVSTLNMLPQPINTDNLSLGFVTMGMWMLPSLFGFVGGSNTGPGLAVFNGRYTVYYNDGR